MESEQRSYELRSGSRSRSQTPLVQNRALVDSEPVEHHYNLRNQSRERSRTPGEVTSTRRSGSRSLPGSVGKIPEHGMETIAEQKEEISKDVSADNQNNRSDGVTSIATRKTERRSERQKARRQIFANGQNEANERSSDLKSDEKRRSISPQRVLTSDYSSEEGEREDPPSRPGSAYEIYKQAGDWWNVFPKTDYTYSQKSQCRYEIAPGVLAMPNMSRRSIHSDGNSSTGSVQSTNRQNLSRSSQERTEIVFGETKERNAQDSMSSDRPYELLPKSHAWDSEATSHKMYTKTHVERYKCHREIFYTVPGGSTDSRQRRLSCSDSTSGDTESRKYIVTSQADSDAELEEAVSITTNKVDQRWNVTRWFSSVTTVIVLWFNRAYEFFNLGPVRRRNYRVAYAYQRPESKWNIVWRYVDHSLQYVYLFMVKIFFLDSWLLSRVSGLRSWLQQRGPKVAWIALLPLLLLSGAYAVQRQSFINLDYLRNFSYGVTETTYHTFNDITNLTFFEYGLLVKYITNLTNSSLYFLPSVNVSLPEMPSIGWN